MRVSPLCMVGQVSFCSDLRSTTPFLLVNSHATARPRSRSTVSHRLSWHGNSDARADRNESSTQRHDRASGVAAIRSFAMKPDRVRLCAMVPQRHSTATTLENPNLFCLWD